MSRCPFCVRFLFTVFPSDLVLEWGSGPILLQLVVKAWCEKREIRVGFSGFMAWFSVEDLHNLDMSACSIRPSVCYSLPQAKWRGTGGKTNSARFMYECDCWNITTGY